jgi:hypothetical protein
LKPDIQNFRKDLWEQPGELSSYQANILSPVSAVSFTTQQINSSKQTFMHMPEQSHSCIQKCLGNYNEKENRKMMVIIPIGLPVRLFLFHFVPNRISGYPRLGIF